MIASPLVEVHPSVTVRASGISRTIVGAVFHELAQLGCSEGLNLLRSNTPVVNGGAADAAFEQASLRLRDPALALTIAKGLAIGSLGEIDYALCTSHDLRTGLVRLARFYRVATERVTLDLVEDSRHAKLVFRATSSEPYSRHWREFAVAVIARRIRQTVGHDVRFREVGFAHGAPPGVDAYTRYFGSVPQFDRDADTLGFRRALLAEPLRTAARVLGDLLEATMREATPRDDALVVRAKRVVATQIENRDLTLATTAKRLAMSKRTLQRELARAGTSHKSIVDDTRRERALALLETGHVAVVDISERLAFSNPRAFFRAFRRWTGTTPAAVRRKVRS
jgi:AraC-like DNA-binding protein